MTQTDRQLSNSNPADKRHCVMVIDDDSTIRATLQAALERKYGVVCLSQGEEVLESIESHSPNLLILDINIPGSDGFEICKAVVAKAKLRKLPILFMTVRKGDKSFLNSLRAGGNSVIAKPFEISALRAKMEYLMQRNPSASPDRIPYVR